MNTLEQEIKFLKKSLKRTVNVSVVMELIEELDYLKLMNKEGLGGHNHGQKK